MNGTFYPDRMAPVPIKTFQVDRVHNFSRAIHAHLGIELAYVTAGEAKHIIYPADGSEPVTGTLKKGVYYAISYGTQHSIIKGSDDFTVINFMINPVYLLPALPVDATPAQIEEALFDGREVTDHIPFDTHCFDKNKNIGPQFEYLTELKTKKPKALRGIYRAKAMELMLTILNENVPDERRPKADIAELVKDYVNVHFNEQLTLSGIAEHFHYAAPYISRRFMETFGVSFGQYLQNLRLTHACDLLIVTDMTVEEISSLVSYSTPSAFRRAFRKQFALTPNEYREKFGS